MNGCYTTGWYDAVYNCLDETMVEIVIIEAFEANGYATKIKIPMEITTIIDLVGSALAESTWNLSEIQRNIFLPFERVGHMSAHGRYFCARKE